MANKRASVKDNSPMDALFEPSAPADKKAGNSSSNPAPSKPPQTVTQDTPTRQTSLFLTEAQTTWLDMATLQAKQQGGKAISKSVIIRTLIEIAMQTSLDFTGIQSQEEARERIETALSSI